MGVRNQSGCLVFRYDKNHNYEILLISSSSGKKWAFPKGGVEKDLTRKESALKETYEEAGVTGHIVGKLGEYAYRKAGREQRVVMYAMLYVKKTSDWPEKGLRVRKWVSIDKARKLLPPELVPFLDHLEATDHVATANSSNGAELDRVYPFLLELPVLKKNGADLRLTAQNIEIKLAGLVINIFENAEHSMAKKLNIEYEADTGEKHHKIASIDSVAGFIGRLCARYVSGFVL